MKKIIFFVLLILQYIESGAQISNVVPSSQSTANAFVSDMQRWSAFGNPAALASLTKAEAGIAFENRFLLKELSTKSIDAAFPLKYFHSGISASHFGYAKYHEMMVGLGFARDFSSRFSMGVQFNYFSTFFAESNCYFGILFPQIGIQTKLSPAIHLGFSVFNPFQSHIVYQQNIKRLPSVFSLGSSYFFSDHLALRIQADKEISSHYRFAAGIEYCMLEKITFKAGIQDAGFLIPGLGFSVKNKNLRLDLTTSLHPLLGLQSSASVRFCFCKP
ncbi:MAG: hypothetical protein JXR27_01770 [Paludibacteraceae bacterium]|nr:hypothetical protein [Paludibacteraceae bacterium]